MSLSGQRILVTGASSGLGHALAKKLSEQGAHVIATARREDRLRALSEAYATIEPVALDITDAKAVAAFCQTCDHLNGAVLNAGMTSVGAFLDGSDQIDETLLQTNVMANIRLARALADPLKGGRLVFVGSIGGMVALPYQAVYSGSKAFIQNFALALREEWSGQTSVGVFAPGGIQTEMTDIAEMSGLKSHLAPVDDVAADLLSFYCSDKALSVPGASNKVSAVVARLLPRSLVSRTVGQAFRKSINS